mgnify:FL=1
MKHGSIALVGSGEYTNAMYELDKSLISSAHKRGKSGPFIQIPTAAGQESEERIFYWRDLGRAHAEKIGIESKFLDIRTREDAMNAEWLEEIKGASLIYFSGGNPSYLANTFRDTPIWTAICKEFFEGSSLAGCSAGAMFMGSAIPQFRLPFGKASSGLGLIPKLMVLPHYDRYFGRIPSPARSFIERSHDEAYVVGIDENTALHMDEEGWKHYGTGRILQLSEEPKIVTDSQGARLNLPLKIS